MIFLIGTISALEFDNKIKYSNGENGNPDLKINLENWFGVGKDYGSAELSSHPDINYIKEVGLGKQVVMYYDFNFLDEYINGLGTPEFTDMKTGKIVEREWRYVYFGNEEYSSPIYNCEEKLSVNGTYSDCNKVGTEIKIVEKWMSYNSNDIPLGKIRIGIEVEVNEGDTIDGVWVIGGKKVSRHAQWTASLNTGLEHYYNMETKTASVLKDEISPQANFTMVNSPTNVSGIVASGVNFTGTQRMGTATINPDSFTEFSWSIWIYKQISDSKLILYGQDAGFGGRELELVGDSVQFTVGDGSSVRSVIDSSNIANNVWTHIVATATDGGNLTLYVNGTQVDTDTISAFGNAATTLYGGSNTGGNERFAGRFDEFGYWNRSLTASEVTQLYNAGMGITYTNNFHPSLTLISPANNTQILSGNNQTFLVNYTLGDGGSTLVNATIFIWDSDNAVFYSNTTEITGITNQTSWDIDFTDLDNYVWNVLVYADVNSSWGINRTFFVSNFIANNITYNSSTFETQSEKFMESITVISGLTPILGKLIYNTTTYSGVTITNPSGNDWILSKTIDIPINVTTNNFFFNFTLDGTEYSTNISSQQVNLTLFTLSNTTYPTKFLNITFKDENTLGLINASIPSSTFVYYLGTGSVNKTLTFINNTNNLEYDFSGTTGGNSLKVLPVLQYRQVSDYPQRIWQPTVRTYNSTITNQVLYLLSTTDGIFVTYQVLTTGESPIEGVNVVSTRVVGSDTIQVGAGTTDSAGTVTFWMNPDFQHTTTFSKTGYDDFVFVHFPTQASYTITLGGTTTLPDDCGQGILQTIKPSQDFLYQDNIYNFNYTISTTYWNFTNFQFTLTYADGSVIGSDSSSSSNGGIVSVNNVNITNSSTITMTYLYEIDTSESDCEQVTGTRVWITQTTTGTEYSISQLATDFNSYVSIGLFGFDDFGKTLISVVVLVLMVGGLSRRYGIANEATIMGILFGTVFILDVGLNFIPKIQIAGISSIDYFFTYITFIMLIGVLIREERR